MVSLSTLTGGDDGLTGLADEDYIGVSSQHTGFSAFEDVFALNLLCVPGVTTGAVMNAALTYTELRKDMFCILHTPKSLTPSEVTAGRGRSEAKRPAHLVHLRGRLDAHLRSAQPWLIL